MKLFINWLLKTLAIVIAAYLLPGISVAGLVPAAILAIVLGIINTFIRPIVVVLTLPINVMTLGLFTLVINAVLVLLAAAFVPGVVVAGFWWALLFAVVLALVSAALDSFSSEK
jgi:putative membrane protein